MDYIKNVEKLWNFDQTEEKVRSLSVPFLTIKEVADILERDRKTILEWCKKRLILAEEVPYGRKKTYKISPHAVIVFLESQKALAENEKKQIEALDHSVFMEDWKKAMQSGLIPGYSYSYSKNTINNYVRYMDSFFEQCSTVTPQNFQKILAQYPDKPDTRRHFYQTMVCFCKFLIGQDALKPEILEQIQKNHRQRPNRNPKQPVLSHDELSRIIQVCKTSQDLAIVLLLASTGLRASECGALKLKDVNFERQEITIREAKWDKSRVLGVHQDVMAVLRRYLEDRPDVSCDYFFLSRLHQKIARCGIRQRIERLGRKTGVVASPHMFRRYFATNNLLNGRSIKEVQTAMGHSSPDMTLKYDRTAKEQVTEAMKNWQTLSSWPQSPHLPSSGNTSALS